MNLGQPLGHRSPSLNPPPENWLTSGINFADQLSGQALAHPTSPYTWFFLALFTPPQERKTPVCLAFEMF